MSDSGLSLPGKFSARFTRGFTRAGVIVGIINVLTFAKVWQSTFDQFGIPLLAVIIAIPIGFVTACILIGVLEERSGVWGDDTLHIWEMAGWNPVELTEAVKRIEKRLEEKV